MLATSLSPIKIGIVEDEVIIADNIYGLLQELGYNPCEPCSDYKEAVKMLDTEAPDVVLLDINLTRGKDGIAIAEHIRNNSNVPFIFLTANSDKATIERAKVVRPNAYIVKPFHKADLYAAIEIASYNYAQQKMQMTASTAAKATQQEETDRNTLFIKDGHYFYKVNLDDILYLSCDHVYLTIHTTTKKYLVRASMQEYLAKLDPERFIRIHRSYAVNVDKIEKINSVYLVVNDEQLPLSKNHRENLMSMLQLA
jgi:two-component system, LytTR family, response regulator LytT